MVIDENKDLWIDDELQTKYRSGIGMLLFLIKYSHPDISNSVRDLSKGNKGANPAHFKKLLRTIRYVLSTRDRALFFRLDKNCRESDVWELKSYCDSDFAGDKVKRISVTGFCIYLFGCLVSWKSHGRKSVTLSSTKAEYVAITELCCEIMFVKSILEFLGMKLKFPIIVNCDNIGAIYLAYNAKTSQRTKHIDVKYHYVREYVEKGMIKIIFVRSEKNDADLWTKNLKEDTYVEHSSKFMKEMVT